MGYRGPSRFYLPLNAALYIFVISNCLSAAYAPIQDCDEIFNYWEPTHYLDHGYGLQTWEYSPEYSIRSWLYVTLHAIIGKASSIWTPRKSVHFYVIRVALATFSAACETRLYSAVCRTLNPAIGLLFLIVVAFSPGFFHASTAFLPSSFAMYTSMLGLTAFLNRGRNKIAEGVMWFGAGAIIGWPFAGALLLPLLGGEILTSIFSGTFQSAIWGVIKGGIRCFVILGLEIGIDSLFFQKPAVVPWNIVAYNVFGGEGRGPNIFGTEPWTFYIRNLLLNFNIWFFLAVSVAPLLVLRALFGSRALTSNQAMVRLLAYVSPFYVWLAIFTVQPHKEERFMYPAYPFLALNAAFALHLVLEFVGTNKPGTLMGFIPGKIKLFAVAALILLSVNAGLLRSLGMATAYGAPLRVYNALETPGVAKEGDTVCLGKEWYRFPSSFFLPDSMRAKFIRSEFSGLLPGEFPDANSMDALLAGTAAIPAGMNDLNEEDPLKYVDISQCAFLVDSYFPSAPLTDLEPDYINDTENWEKVSCKKFLDVPRTSILGRVAWIPDLPFVPERYRRQWGDEWSPSSFKRPEPVPYPDWNVETSKPIPYRPFRYGPKYFITMGLRSMKWDDWIELDNHYPRFHADKSRRIIERGSKCCKTAPEAMDGAIELLEELASYLPARYPSMFRKTHVGIDNLFTGESFNIIQRPLPEDPMITCSRLIQDDLALMFERPDGQYYLLAGAILLAGFWRLQDKFGMPLSEIHTSGDVPQFQEKLEKGMVNFFRRIKPEDPVLRNNYFLQVDDELAWSHSIGSEDSDGISWNTAEKNRAIEYHYFRSERQSLRRLPRSGAVVFTIRTYFEPVTEIVKEPYVPGRLASAVRSWGDDVSRYKGKEKYEEVLLEYLDQKHQEQVASGLELEKEDEVRAYPY
ncbi:Alg9-like mannosyltransferase family-domain-containing protein [Talaromyces proteolyticus]|uniref:Mannosyltransferase n=1 Tax=Talaromyces proteolyticus TaxID=1131652 RepID=A0AAD4Q1I9_9EURO|nr:Alg9-like mannosyltransferase family-domain-containing protein [Talaromyces proteolyticus]KAH8698593.1 Alg9-like mannosyltransferase family-domain-containing protein [Talaromyces proteolyticus]